METKDFRKEYDVFGEPGSHFVGGVSWFVRCVHDLDMVDCIYTKNEYNIPEDMWGKVVLDLGANIGTFARLCAERGAKVWAVEPEKKNFSCLLKNTEGLPVTCINSAASGEDSDSTPFFVCDHSTSIHSLLRAHYLSLEVLVNTRSLDSLVRDAGGRVDLAKIDIEGGEFLLLETSKLEGIEELVIEFHEAVVDDPKSVIDAARSNVIAKGFKEISWTDCESIKTKIFRGKRAI